MLGYCLLLSTAVLADLIDIREREECARYEVQIGTSGSITGHVVIPVAEDGYIRFMLKVVDDLDSDFFLHQQLHVNLPYRKNGRLRNQMMSFSDEKIVEVELPLQGMEGQLIELVKQRDKPLESVFTRVTIPLIQYGAVSQFSYLTSGLFDDFRQGSYMEALQWYVMLDSSLRVGRDITEYLEVYLYIDPVTGHYISAILIGSVLVFADHSDFDFSSHMPLASTRSGMYSALVGQYFEITDKEVITPYVSETMFPSQGTTQSFGGRLTSLLARGPISVVILKRASDSPSLLIRKLLIKSVSELRGLSAHIAQKTNHRGIEWFLNGVLAFCAGADASPQSMEQTYRDELQQQLGSHGHTQLVTEIHGQLSPGSGSHGVSYANTPWIGLDFLVGWMIYRSFNMLGVGLGSSGVVAQRVGKGVGVSMMLRSISPQLVEPVISQVSNIIYQQISDDMVWSKSLFRKDRLIEIGHRIYGTEDAPLDSLRSSPLRDEL